MSQAGLFPCKAIFHVCGEKDAVIIQQLVCHIVEYCESYELKSVAIPAICAGESELSQCLNVNFVVSFNSASNILHSVCAGAGGLDPGVVASAILQGIKAATSSTPLYFLTDIRLVLIKINVFLAFKDEAMQMFSTAVINRGDSQNSLFL